MQHCHKPPFFNFSIPLESLYLLRKIDSEYIEESYAKEESNGLNKLKNNSGMSACPNIVILWDVLVVVLVKMASLEAVRAMEVVLQEVAKNYQYSIGCQT